MGHWEQIAADGLRAPPVRRWRKLAAGLVIAAGTTLAYGIIILQLWKFYWG